MMFSAQYARALLCVTILVSALSNSVAQTLKEPVYYPDRLETTASQTVSTVDVTNQATVASSTNNPVSFMAGFANMPEFYSSTNVAGFGDSVDPYSQVLTVVHTDAVLKTNGGLNIPVTRFYRHFQHKLFGKFGQKDDDDTDIPRSAAQIASRKTASQKDREVRNTVGNINTLNSPLGLGWNMHFGRIYSRIFNVCDKYMRFVFETSTGSTQEFYWHEGNQRFVSKQFWTAQCTQADSDTPAKLVIKSPDGTKYYADYYVKYDRTHQVYVTKITDPNNNRIDISYGQKNGVAYIKTVNSDDNIQIDTDKTDASGQKLKTAIDYHYNLTGKWPKLTRIDIPGLKKRTLTYTVTTRNTDPYYQEIDWLGNEYNVLKRVMLPTYKSWEFDYNDSDRDTEGKLLLNKQTHPEGRNIEYVYGERPVWDAGGNQVDGKYTMLKLQKWKDNKNQPLERLFQDRKVQAGIAGVRVIEPNGDIKLYRYFHYECCPENIPLWKAGELKSIEWYDKKTETVVQAEKYDYTKYLLSDRSRWSIYREGADEKQRLFTAVLKKKIVKRDTQRNNTHSYEYNYKFDQTTGENRSSMLPYSVQAKGENGLDKTTTYTYTSKFDTFGVRKTSETLSDISGIVSYEYDTRGNLKKETAYDVETSYSYRSDGEVSTITDANGHVTSYSNYKHGIPQRVTTPENISMTRTVRAPGLLTSQTNGRGYKTTYEYEDSGRIKKITPSEQAPTYFYYEYGFSTVAKGRLCVIDQLDNLGRIVERTARAFEKQVIIEGADPENNTCESIDESTEYPDYMLNRGTDTTVTFTYDEMGRRDFVSLPNNSIGTKTTFDALNRVRSECIGSICTTIKFLEKNQVEITDGEKRVQVSTYRGINGDQTLIKNVKKLKDKEDITVDLTKDNLNRLTNVTSHKLTATYKYEKEKRIDGALIMVNYPFLSSYSDTQTGTATYTYDNVGNLKTKTHNNFITNYDYDALNRLKEVRYADGSGTVKYRYDNNSNVKSASRIVYKDPQNQRNVHVSWTKSYKYNSADQLTELTHTKVIPKQSYTPYKIGYDYLRDGSLSKLTYPSGNTVEYAPDAYGRPTKVGEYATNIQYHANGGISNYRLGNGKTVSYGLDSLDRVNKILVAPNVLSRSYGYDDSHNITSRRDDLTQTASMITYDDANRLIRETSGSNSIGIDYRPDQNIQSITKNGVTRTIGIDAQHRPASGFDGEAFGYDVFGNINAMTGGKTPQTFIFFSDGTLVGVGAKHNAYRANFATPRNADTPVPHNYIALSGEFPTNDSGLLGIARINEQNMFYFYDADNQRTVRANPQNKREFMIYGAEGLLAEYDDMQQPQAEYIRLRGKVIAQRGKAGKNECTKWLFCDSFEDSSGILGGASSGNVTYLHNDILGTPVAATDKSGNIKWRSYRMAFGMVENPSAEPTRSEFPIGYTGHEFDAETGLTYAQARYYRRDSGAFISPDPIPFRESDLTTVNRYVYGMNNPYRFVDPTGTDATIVMEGNKISITIGIRYFGNEHTAEIEKRFNEGIEKYWTGQFGKYTLTTKVTNQPQNKIKIDNIPQTAKPNRSHVACVGCNKGTWEPSETGLVAAHEAGHLMGLPDMYTDQIDSQGNTYSQPIPGWENTIMGYARPTSKKDVRLLIEMLEKKRQEEEKLELELKKMDKEK